MKRFITLFFVFMLCTFAAAQRSVPPAGGMTKAEQAAIEVRTKLDAWSHGRLRTEPINLVFLVDTSQVKAKSAYGNFARSFMARMVEDFKSNPGAFSIYLYQLDLYNMPQYRAVAIPFKSNSSGRVDTAIPGVPIPVRAEGIEDPESDGTYRDGDGHDSTGSRASLLRIIEESGKSDTTILVQITTSTTNEAPRRPSLDERIRRQNSRDVAEASALQNVDVGGPYETEAQNETSRPHDVFIWAYGAPRWAVPPPKPPPPPPAPPDLRPVIAGVLVLAVLVGIGIGISLLLRPVQVGFDHGGRVPVKPGESIKVYAFGGDSPDPKGLLLTSDQSLGSGHDHPQPGEQVGYVKRSWFGFELEGASGYRVVHQGKDTTKCSVQPGAKVKFRRPNAAETASLVFKKDK